MSATLSSKGQITIPKHIRDLLGLKPGEQVEFIQRGQSFVLVAPKASEVIEQTAGSLRAYLPSGRRKSDDEMLNRVAKEMIDARHRR
jgi:antitoxin PrlF